jgi:hypothetical protein
MRKVKVIAIGNYISTIKIITLDQAHKMWVNESNSGFNFGKFIDVLKRQNYYIY